MERQLMKVSEAADFLRMSSRTLYARTDIPRHKLPGSRLVVFDRDELLAWAKSGATKPTVIEGPGHLEGRNYRISLK